MQENRWPEARQGLATLQENIQKWLRDKGEGNAPMLLIRKHKWIHGGSSVWTAKEVEKRKPWESCLWACELTWPLWKTVWRLLTKLKTERPPYDPVVSKGSEVSLQRGSCTKAHSVALFIRAMRQEQGAHQQKREMWGVLSGVPLSQGKKGCH